MRYVTIILEIDDTNSKVPNGLIVNILSAHTLALQLRPQRTPKAKPAPLPIKFRRVGFWT